MRGVRAQRDGDRNRSGSHCERQSKGIEGLVECLVVMWARMYPVPFIVVSPLQQGPASGDDNQPSPHLHRRERYPKERQNVCPNQVRANQQEETVDRDLPRERSPLYGAILPGQREKNWATAERIHDGEQSADNEDDVADSFHCSLSGEFRMSRRVSHVRIDTRVGEPRNTPSELLVRLRGRMKR